MAARRNVAKAAEAVAEKAAGICRACWPDGWPHLSHSASCEHGTFVRDPEANPPDDDTKTPDADTKTEDTPPAGDKTEDTPPAGDKTGA